ncbi:MAG TPA: DUF1304 family protein [Arthrobacter sp.]|nr:DUF1304 family protein [Arthrobacter sp.]
MNAVSQLFAVIAALIYIAVFPLESFLMHRPWAQKLLSTPPQNVPAVMMWAIPTGFRNLMGASIPGTLGATMPALIALVALPF